MGIYTVHLVGESRYQPTIRRLRIGGRIELRHEPDNKYDDLAVVALDPAGDPIGYIERGGFVQRLVATEGKEVFARVEDIIGGTKGKRSLGVVLEVRTAKDALAAIETYQQLSQSRGCLAALFGR